MKAPERPGPVPILDSAVATDDEEGWSSEGNDEPEEANAVASSSSPRPADASSPTSLESSSRRKGFRHAKRAVHAVGNHWNRRRGSTSASARRGSLSQAELGAAPAVVDIDEPRGREGRPPQVISNDYYGSPRSQNSGSSYINGRPTTAGSSSMTAVSRASRPGTADSSLRHQRLDSIRAMQTTRENSPSRSVRFVERTMSSGSVGNGGTSSPRTTAAD